MERRQFFYLAGVGVSTLMIGNFLASCSKDDDPDDPGTPGNGKKLTLDLTDPAFSSLTTPGNSIIKDNVLIIHTSNGYVALSKTCTHQGCTVGFDGTEVVCPCHGSKFSTVGSVLNGPATTPLTKYKTELLGNILTITL